MAYDANGKWILDWSLIDYTAILQDIQNNFTVPTLNGTGGFNNVNAYQAGVSDFVGSVVVGDFSKMPVFRLPPEQITDEDKLKYYELMQSNLEDFFKIISGRLELSENLLGGYLKDKAIGELVEKLVLAAVTFATGGIDAIIFGVFLKLGGYVRAGGDPYGIAAVIGYCKQAIEWLSVTYRKYEVEKQKIIAKIKAKTKPPEVPDNNSDTNRTYYLISGVLIVLVIVSILIYKKRKNGI